MAYNDRVVLEGAKDINGKLWMVRLTNEKQPTETVSQTNISFENANHVTTDQASSPGGSFVVSSFYAQLCCATYLIMDL